MAPQTVAQLVMWNVADGFEWETVTRVSAPWADRRELALAKSFVERLRAQGVSQADVLEPSPFYFDLAARDAGDGPPPTRSAPCC